MDGGGGGGHRGRMRGLEHGGAEWGGDEVFQVSTLMSERPYTAEELRNAPVMGVNTLRTASAINTELMEGQQAYSMLRDHPHLQAERIAGHYTKLAQMAMQLRMIVERRNEACLRGEDHVNTDDVIARMVEEIKGSHRQDFGIPLEWPHST